jgi:UDP-GlcNAc:undecaprenyl-phosphate/decaprenyl-phosphate GlcNAc-1-phosphate transferase
VIPGLIAFVAAVVLGFAARAVGPRIGAVDVPSGALKPHAKPISYLGGVAVALAVAIGMTARGWPLHIAAVAALGGALTLGIVDDTVELLPLPRLVLQTVLAIAIVAGGVRADALPEVLAWLVAIALFVGAMNGVNMVDGIDGLAAGAVVISAVGLAAISHAHGGGTGLALVTTGAAAGFLIHNLPPARLFLGDGGAYFLGAVIAVGVLHAGGKTETLPGALTCLGVFALDPALAILRRRMSGVSLTEGDRGHLYDQLAARGLSPVAVLAATWAIHTVFVVIGVTASSLPTAGAIALSAAVWVTAVALLVAFGFVTFSARS